MGWDKFVDPNLVWNRTYTYLFPMIGLSSGMKRDEFLYLRGLFCKNDDFPELFNKLYMLLKFNKEREFVFYEDKLRTLDIYDFNYEPDKYHSIFVFNIPDEYKREYEKFIQSKYSEFSDNYKNSIIKFHGFKKNESGNRVIGVLYKKEIAYKLQEEELNDGLPESSWVKIPRDQEIGKLLEEVIEMETYSEDLKIKNKMFPNKSV